MAVAVILLLSLSVTPSIGIPFNDDTTPPVTVHALDPSEPDGNNGWYVRDVNVTLTATDDLSGVNVTYYRVEGGEWEIYTEPFTLSEDGNKIIISYYSIDYAGNVEIVKHTWVYIDQTEPVISITYNILGGNIYQGFDIEFEATATDDMSGMDYVEFLPNTFNVYGLINDFEINGDYVKINALFVIISQYFQLSRDVSFEACGFDEAGNMNCDGFFTSENSISITPGIYIFKSLILPNNYIGHIGDNFIFATFNND